MRDLFSMQGVGCTGHGYGLSNIALAKPKASNLAAEHPYPKYREVTSPHALKCDPYTHQIRMTAVDYLFYLFSIRNPTKEKRAYKYMKIF